MKMIMQQVQIIKVGTFVQLTEEIFMVNYFCPQAMPENLSLHSCNTQLHVSESRAFKSCNKSCDFKFCDIL